MAKEINGALLAKLNGMSSRQGAHVCFYWVILALILTCDIAGADTIPVPRTPGHAAFLSTYYNLTQVQAISLDEKPILRRSLPTVHLNVPSRLEVRLTYQRKSSIPTTPKEVGRLLDAVDFRFSPEFVVSPAAKITYMQWHGLVPTFAKTPNVNELAAPTEVGTLSPLFRTQTELHLFNSLATWYPNAERNCLMQQDCAGVARQAPLPPRVAVTGSLVKIPDVDERFLRTTMIHMLPANGNDLQHFNAPTIQLTFAVFFTLSAKKAPCSTVGCNSSIFVTDWDHKIVRRPLVNFALKPAPSEISDVATLRDHRQQIENAFKSWDTSINSNTVQQLMQLLN